MQSLQIEKKRTAPLRATLKMFFLGTGQVWLDPDTEAKIRSRKEFALLAYLATESNRTHSRERLMGLLWPELNQTQARNNLRVALARLRKAIEYGDPPLFRSDRRTLSFTMKPWTEGDVWLDVAEFDRLLTVVDSHDHADPTQCPTCLADMLKAADLYQGEFLQGFYLDECEEFEHWLLVQRERYHIQVIDLLTQVEAAQIATTEWKAAEKTVRQRLRLDPLDESAHRALMQVLALSGVRNAALAHYDICCRTLNEELSVEPDTETVALYTQIRDGQLEAATSRQANEERPSVLNPPTTPVDSSHNEVEQSAHLPTQTLTTPLHTLPTQTTPFVGREGELQEIAAQLLEPTCHLLTLAGPGGIGKTRLSLQVASQVAEQFTDGAAFVPLANAETMDEMVMAINAALALPPAPSLHPTTQLLDYLSDKELLLILDNFEQLSNTGDLLSRMIDNAPGTKLLLTSRVRLNLYEESSFEVVGLSIPPHSSPFQNGRANHEYTQAVLSQNRPFVRWDQASIDELTNYSAVELFVRGARRVQAGFELTEENAGAVVRICQVVDGLPLALELAAAWVRALSCQEIADEIEASLDFLESSSANVPARHQSIQAVFDYSWRQLTSAEQRVLVKLSVFRGGFERQSAADIAGARLPLLVSLIDKSFVRRVKDRYEMHELLRQLASQKLATDTSEYRNTERTHATYFAGWLQSRRPLVWRADAVGIKTLTEIDTELQNIRAAWRWITQEQLYEQQLTALDTLYYFFEIRSRYQEGVEFLRSALEGVDRDLTGKIGVETLYTRQLLKTKLLSRLGDFEQNLGHDGQAEHLLKAALNAIRTIQGVSHEGSSETAFCWLRLGSLATNRGDHERARELFQYCLETYQDLDDAEGVAQTLNRLGVVAYNNKRLSEAKHFYFESYQAARQLNHYSMLATTLINLGKTQQALGQREEANRHLKECLALEQQFGGQQMMAYVFINLATIASEQGNHVQAIAYVEEALPIFHRLGSRLGIALALRQRGDSSRLAGHYADAAIYLKESLQLSQEYHLSIDEALVTSSLGRLALDQGEFDEAQRLAQSSFTMCTRLGVRAGVGYNHNLLGHIAIARHEYQAGHSHFQQAVTIAQDMEAPLILVEALLGFANILAKIGNREKALEIASAVTEYPPTTREIQMLAQSLYERLEPLRSSTQMKPVQTTSHCISLENVDDLLNHILHPVSQL